MMAKAKNKQLAKAEGKREPNEREAAAIAAARQAHATRAVRPDFVEVPDETGVLRLEPGHSDLKGHPYLVQETFGTGSEGFTSAALWQLANITARGGKPDLHAMNASLAMVGAVAPKDELEAALAVDMAATHELAMEMLRRMRVTDDRDAMRDYGNMATKLSRTFTAQMKQLSDWRRGGEQVVRHVHVYEGGQAVVAETVNVGGQGNGKLAFNPHEQGALISAMLGQNEAGHAVPVPGHEGPETLSATRRKNQGGGRTGRKQE